MSRNILKHRCGKNLFSCTRSKATRCTWSQHPLQVGFGHTAATRCFERPLWTSEMEGFDGLDWLGQKFIVISQLYMNVRDRQNESTRTWNSVRGFAFGCSGLALQGFWWFCLSVYHHKSPKPEMINGVLLLVFPHPDAQTLGAWPTACFQLTYFQFAVVGMALPGLAKANYNHIRLPFAFNLLISVEICWRWMMRTKWRRRFAHEREDAHMNWICAHEGEDVPMKGTLIMWKHGIWHMASLLVFRLRFTGLSSNNGSPFHPKTTLDAEPFCL